MNDNAIPEDMLSIRILYYKGALISTRKTSSKAISEIRASLAEKKGPSSIADLLLTIIDGLTGKMQQYLQDIEEQIEQFELDTEQIGDIIEVQKALLRIKRFIRPQQYAIADFSSSEVALLTNKTLMVNYALSNITRINETIEFFLGELALLKEQIQQLREDKISRNSYLFTLIASIFLPTSFLTGLKLTVLVNDDTGRVLLLAKTDNLRQCFFTDRDMCRRYRLFFRFRVGIMNKEKMLAHSTQKNPMRLFTAIKSIGTDKK